MTTVLLSAVFQFDEIQTTPNACFRHFELSFWWQHLIADRSKEAIVMESIAASITDHAAARDDFVKGDRTNRCKDIFILP